MNGKIILIAMQYKRYKKLRKYVNGNPTDEFKKGALVGIVEANSQADCEREILEEWKKVEGEFICEEIPEEWLKVEGEFICEEIVTPEPIVIAPAIMKVLTTTENEIVKFDDGDPTDNYYYRFWGTAKCDEGTVINNTWVLFAKPGTYTITLDLNSREFSTPGNIAYTTSVPLQATEIVDWGDTTAIARKADYTISTSKVTKIPYGKNLFKNDYTIDTWIEDDGDRDIWADSKITDVDDNLFQNATKVLLMYGYNKLTLEYGIFDWDISEIKYARVFSNLTNLTEIELLFIHKKVTSTLGIFKNNPKLISAKDVFKNLNITVLIEDEFSNNPNLLDITGVFEGCTRLTTMPNFKENVNITNFNRAFYGCTNLTGSTPVDENGYKLWERAGKPGYPATIDGTSCFYGCTKLDDYDQIPDDWK